MKAVAVYPGKKTFGVIDIAEPVRQSPTQVKMRMIDVGICGTDKEIVAFEYGTPPPGDEYLVIGHESLGEVVEVGSGVQRFAVGELVVPSVRRPCGGAHCVPCALGRQDFCFTGKFTERGIKQQHGYMTEFVVEEERWLTLAPSSLRDVAVLVEPLTIAEKAMRQIWQIQERLPWIEYGPGRAQGHNALVLGAGPVGLLGAMKLVLEGFPTYVYSRTSGMPEKKAVVESIGAKFIDADTVTVDQTCEVIGTVDLIYEAVGASSLAFQMITHLDANGVFIFTGVPGRRGPVKLDTDTLMRDLVLKNQIVFGTVNAGLDAFADAINDLELFSSRWPKAVAGLITKRFPIADAAVPLSGKAPAAIKNVVSIR